MHGYYSRGMRIARAAEGDGEARILAAVGVDSIDFDGRDRLPARGGGEFAISDEGPGIG